MSCQNNNAWSAVYIFFHKYLCCESLTKDPHLSPDASIVARLGAGCTTGAMAVAFAQPTDVVKVRFQAEVRLADGSRRYNGTMDAYRTIARDEGVRGLWKGELAVSQLSCSIKVV